MSAYIRHEWLVPLSINGTIVDVETTSITPQEGDLITAGFFSGNKICIFQRIDPTDGGKQLFMSAIANWSDFCMRPFYAYNKAFEERWLRTGFDHDLMEKWRVKAELDIQNGKLKKWPRVSELVSLPHAYYGGSDIDGRDVPHIWKMYAESAARNIRLLDPIIEHNLNDLIREACLLLWDETGSQAYAKTLLNDARKRREIMQ